MRQSSRRQELSALLVSSATEAERLRPAVVVISRDHQFCRVDRRNRPVPGARWSIEYPKVPAMKS
jgi:hypothetical protein